MSKFFTLLVSLILGCTTLKANQNKCKVYDFTDVKLKTLAAVNIQYGKICVIDVIGEERFKNLVKIISEGPTVYIDGSALPDGMKDKIRIHITLPELNLLEASTVAQLTVNVESINKTSLKPIKFDFNTLAKVNLNGNNFKGKVLIKGISISSFTNDVNASTMMCDLTAINTYHSKANLNRASLSLRAVTSVDMLKGRVEDLNIHADAVKKLDVNVSERLSVKATNFTHIKIAGNPKIITKQIDSSSEMIIEKF